MLQLLHRIFMLLILIFISVVCDSFSFRVTIKLTSTILVWMATVLHSLVNALWWYHVCLLSSNRDPRHDARFESYHSYPRRSTFLLFQTACLIEDKQLFVELAYIFKKDGWISIEGARHLDGSTVEVVCEHFRSGQGYENADVSVVWACKENDLYWRLSWTFCGCFWSAFLWWSWCCVGSLMRVWFLWSWTWKIRKVSGCSHQSCCAAEVGTLESGWSRGMLVRYLTRVCYEAEAECGVCILSTQRRSWHLAKISSAGLIECILLFATQGWPGRFASRKSLILIKHSSFRLCDTVNAKQ